MSGQKFALLPCSLLITLSIVGMQAGLSRENANADDMHFRRGLSIFYGNPEGAAAEFDQCKNLAALPPASLVRVALVYEETQQMEKALKWSKQAIDKGKGKPQTLPNDYLATAYEIRGHANHALQKLDEAVADYLLCDSLRKGGAPVALGKAGDIRTRQKRYDEALKLFDRAIASPNKITVASLHLYKGICLQQMNHIEDAIKQYSEGIAACRKSSREHRLNNAVTLNNCYVHRAECYDKLGKTQLAKADRQVQETDSRGIEADLFGKR